MLKLRIITASIILPLIIWLILFSSNQAFLISTTLIIFIAIIEWLKLLKIHENFVIFIFLLLIYITILSTLGYYEAGSLNQAFNYPGILFLANLFWFGAFINVLIYSICPKSYKNFCDASPNFIKVLGFISCIFALIPSWIGLNYMKRVNPTYLLIVLSVVISVDLGGYIIGKLFGKHKLTMVSPNKTWEGLIGSYVFCVITLSIMVFITNINIKFSSMIIISGIGFVLAVIGDLFESLLKRIAEVKDSGNLLPGHGGVLDRIDSFCAVLPAFGLLLYIISQKY